MNKVNKLTLKRAKELVKTALDLPTSKLKASDGCENFYEMCIGKLYISVFESDDEHYSLSVSVCTGETIHFLYDSETLERDFNAEKVLSV